jgi:endonuclease YncB( thermonuclease family)
MKSRHLVLMLLICSCSTDAQVLSGRVVGVTDGDTFTLLATGNRRVKIRVSDIDAPEKSQPFGSKSKKILSDLIFGQEVSLKNTSLDRYGRTLARVSLDSVDVSSEMVKLGAAWVYVRFSSDETLPPLQAEAQRSKVGLWSLPSPVAPWEWRKGDYSNVPQSTQESSTNDCNIKGNINGKGDRIYHILGSQSYAATVVTQAKGEKWFCTETEARQAGWRPPRG